MKLILATITSCLTATFAAPVFADQILRDAMHIKLVDHIEEITVLGMADMARKLAKLDCDYTIEQTKLTFSYLREGINIETALQEEFGSRYNYGVAAYIARLADFKAFGPTREVESKVAITVAVTCESETENVIAAATK